MLDKFTLKLIKKPLSYGASWLNKKGVKATQITLTGFMLGMLAIPCLAWQHYELALMLILANRIFDGLDGALARIQGISDAGGFLDISLDFLFYSAVPLGFIFALPSENALAGAVLIFTFVGTGSSFLAFAVMASKHQISSPIYQHKSFYYMTGLTGGTETLICFILMCLIPSYFALIAYCFAAMCLSTTFFRIYSGYQTLCYLNQNLSKRRNKKGTNPIKSA